MTDLYRKMILIRLFEERLLKMAENGELHGTIHTCIGQEAIAVGVMAHVMPGDIVISSHRCHGHYLARTGDIVGLLAEIMGKKGGLCGGRGGSQHICDGTFFSNGIQGNMMPVAAGMALAEKRNKTGNIVVIFVGDGTFGEGALYEALNLIGLWELPVLIVVEYNGWAQSTRAILSAWDIAERIRGFGIRCVFGDVADKEIPFSFNRVRACRNPIATVQPCSRLGPHSKGDDCRPEDELDIAWANDPIGAIRVEIGNPEMDAMMTEVNRELDAAWLEAEDMESAR